MTTPADTADVSSLKGRRRQRGSKATSTPPPANLAPGSPTTEEPPQIPDRHENMASAMGRLPTLAALDPLAKRVLPVIELGGHVPHAVLADNYIVSPFDAAEQVIPRGCTTPISRTLWCKGQHVRRDIFRTYLDTHPELDPDTQTVQLPEGDGASEGEGQPPEGEGGESGEGEGGEQVLVGEQDGAPAGA